MKKTSLKNLFIALTMISTIATANAQSTSDVDLENGQLLEIGGGSVTSKNTIEALIRVNTNVTYDRYDGSYYVLVRMNADGSISKNNLNYVDFELHALGAGFNVEGTYLNTFVEGTLLNINYQRNVSINMNDQLLISLVGIRGGATLEVHEDLKILAESAVDFVALGVSSKRVSDSATLSSQGSSGGLAYRVQLAVELMKRFRIAAGVEGSIVSGKGTTYNTGAVVCNTYYDYWYSGYYYSNYSYCYDQTATDYAQTFTTRSSYLSVSAQITERLKAFGKVAYNVYTIKDVSREIENSQNYGWNFLFGVTYTLGNNNNK